MGRLIVLLPALSLAAALALSSCGGGEDAKLLSGQTASQINENLDQVQQRVAEGDCIGAENAVAEVRIQIEGLSGVDRRLKAALGEGAGRLEEAVSRCDEEAEETEETEPALETTVEDEAPKKPEKPEKEKPGKEQKELEEPVEEEAGGHEGPTLPPQSNGKGEEKGGGPPAPEPEDAPPSGGVGPSTGVGGN